MRLCFTLRLCVKSSYCFKSSRAWRRALSVISAPVSMRANSSTRPALSNLPTLTCVRPFNASFCTTRWLSANRAIQRNSVEQAKNYQRLASGNRITEAGDDAAGLSISENLRAQIRSMGQAERNANDGISFVQVAEGGLTEIGNMLIRMRELAVQASSDTIGDTERRFVNEEVQSLLQEVDRIANVTTYNGTNLLNGEANKSELQFQVGIKKEAGDADRIIFNPFGYFP